MNGAERLALVVLVVAIIAAAIGWFGSSEAPRDAIAAPTEPLPGVPRGPVGIRADGVTGLTMEDNTFVGFDNPIVVTNSKNVKAKRNRMR